ncbi:MAG: type II toxin-antitoxin system VapC family toxin [Oscillospiraceae bacterium]|jgi:tRNA(fMet)-specific endonuclease VapC|nr:type II toxin-antitoxin system VapC family toxin [Oscillospiraceae bacterium]
MTFMLDTNIVIAALRKRPTALAALHAHAYDDMTMSAITLAELRHGIAKSADPARNERALLQITALIHVLPFDQLAAVRYGDVIAGLERSGSPIGVMDALIASHALSCGCVLVTHNTREFTRVSGLRVEDWLE